MADIVLRGLPERVHSALRRAAERNHQSLNGEILARLEASVSGQGVEPEDLLRRIEDRRARLSVPDLDDGALAELKESGRA